MFVVLLVSVWLNGLQQEQFTVTTYFSAPPSPGFHVMRSVVELLSTKEMVIGVAGPTDFNRTNQT